MLAESGTGDITEALVELIRRAATDLPRDVEEALRAAFGVEQTGSAAAQVLDTILENVEFARSTSRPMCQDTGVPILYVRHPRSASTCSLRAQIEAAVAEATRLAYLRPNAVDGVTGVNSGNNVGRGFPTTHFWQWGEDYVHVDLLLKGGGSENVSAQYSLPHPPFGAARDLEGVRRVVLHAVHTAQGRGCPPGVVGVAIGGDRGTGFAHAKAQLMRLLPSESPVPALAALEQRLRSECNSLGIGPMGLGGRTTILGVKVGALHRLPACYFVTVAFNCWACRRSSWDSQQGFHIPAQRQEGHPEVSMWPSTS